MAAPAALAESRTTPRPAVEHTELHSACRWYNAGMEAGLIRPAPVRPGATVAVVSPCSPVVCWWEHRAAQAGAYLESLGLRVRVMPHSGRAMAGRQVSPQARAEDLHAAFADPDVAVVLAAIGGDHAAELLPHLDYQLIRANPKLFQGYSDLTVLHWALLGRAGLITFYGPALLPELGEHPTVLPYTDTWLRDAWFGTTPLRFAPATTWTDEFLDWDRRQDRTRPRDLRPSGGWVTIREGRAEGQLVAGCLETICRHLKGSPAWLDLRGALLVLETSEEVPPPHRVDAYLAELADAAVFDQVTGLVVARPYGYDQAQALRLWSVVASRTEASGVPALGNVECGHADPMLTLPIGVRARVDATAKHFEMLEPALQPPNRLRRQGCGSTAC
jgi:muramoyltetrapeptide carboxypeptidase